MNKILMMTCGILIASSVALTEDTTTETCANGAGAIITGHITGDKYCKSNKTMNWWNAVSWCDAQNKTLIALSDCASTKVNVCDNFIGYGYLWLYNYHTQGAYHANNTGQIIKGDSWYENVHAICK